MHGQAAQFRVRCVQVDREKGREMWGVTTNLYAYGCHGYTRSNFNCNFSSNSSSNPSSTFNSGCDPTFQFKIAQPRLKHCTVQARDVSVSWDKCVTRRGSIIRIPVCLNARISGITKARDSKFGRNIPTDSTMSTISLCYR